MAEYMQVPTRLLVKGEGLGFDELALIEPLAIGAHGVRRACVQQGEYVLVVGAGPIGLGIMEFARMAGGQVIAADVNGQRLSFCREKLNVDFTINVQTEDIMAA
jgi:threonine dehydrogenase-like Zn-dependent dehydrogenase